MALFPPGLTLGAHAVTGSSEHIRYLFYVYFFHSTVLQFSSL